MGPVSTITRTFQKAIDLVVKPEHHTEDRGRSDSNLPRRTSSTRRSDHAPSDSRRRSRTEGSSGQARNRGRPVHLLAESPSGFEDNIIRLPSTRHRSGRRRSLQESLNNKVDTSNPPPMPEMSPRWQEVINAIRGEKKGGPRTEHEEEVRRNFERLKEKRWDDLSPEEQAQETKNYVENKKRLKAWDLAKDITRQTRKVELADEEAEEKARAAASAKRRLERLKRRQSKHGSSTLGTPRAGKFDRKPKEPEEAPGTDEASSLDLPGQKAEDSNRGNISQHTAESGQVKHTPSSPRQVPGHSNNQLRPQSHRSSTAPASAIPSKRESAAPQRPAQSPRSSTVPISTILSRVESPGSVRPSPITESSTASSPLVESEAQASIQQRIRPDAHSNALASAKVASGGRGTQIPPQTAASRTTTKKMLQPSQLRQVSNAKEVETSAARRPASGQSQTARVEESKSQNGFEAAANLSKLSLRQQHAQSTKSVGSKAQQQTAQREENSTRLQPSRTRLTTVAPLTEKNLKSASDQFIVESASAFEVQTELNRGPGDNMRTIIEGLALMTPSEIAEEDDKRMCAAREALEEEERREQEKLLVTEFDRGPGNNMRTNLEGMEPMTSEDLRAEDRKWKSRKRQQLEAEEESEQAKLVQTEFNRGLGDMMRYGLRSPQVTYLEGMVPMTSEDIKQEARERLEEEERRLHDELLKTRFNRGPGDNMRTVIEGMVSKSSESMTLEEIRKKKKVQSQWKSGGTSRYNTAS
ncbi:hypothetical protein BKA64DRAFT_752478 [Cadophora sp. MPI-SDFR-AT-0126]|nr:hypothetical protein BKA64DRAFT_752478 [Leotiomycetes sp. MPI-SDFR-AT-0126]